MTRKWMFATSLLVVILLLSACDISTAGVLPNGILPGKALTWKTLALPPALSSANQQANFAVSPYDGNLAYDCSVPTNTSSSSPVQFGVWATDDAGATWSLRSDLPQAMATGGYCSIDIASVDGQTLVAQDETYDPTQAYSALSTDGGRSWSLFAPQTSVNALFVTPQIAYAILLSPKGVCGQSAVTDLAGNLTPRLCSSIDGLKTWQPIDKTFINQGNLPATLHYNPASGSLLVQTSTDNSNDPGAFYITNNQGKTWQITLLPEAQTLAVIPDGLHWRVCSAYFGPPGTIPTNMLQCSVDGGQTWTDMPALNVETKCEPCMDGYSGISIEQAYLEAVLSDGTVLAAAKTEEEAASMTDSSANHANLVLYRLTPKSANWQTLGPLPFHDDVNPSLYFTPTGQVWYTSDNQIATATYQA